MRKIKLYASVGTLVSCENLKSIKDILPTHEQIVDHVKAQKQGEQFQLIQIEVTAKKMNEIIDEVAKKACLKKGYQKTSFLVIFWEDKKHPLIFIKKISYDQILDIEGNKITGIFVPEEEGFTAFIKDQREIQVEGKTIEDAITKLKQSYIIKNKITPVNLQSDQEKQS